MFYRTMDALVYCDFVNLLVASKYVSRARAKENVLLTSHSLVLKFVFLVAALLIKLYMPLVTSLWMLRDETFHGDLVL